MEQTVKITTQPESVVAAEGTVAKVSVKATGVGLTYTWYYRNKGQTSFTLTTSFKTNTYSVSMNASRDGREVYCIITDCYGNCVQTDIVTLSMGPIG